MSGGAAARSGGQAVDAVVFAVPGEASVVVAGVPLLERLLRTLARCGVRQVVVVRNEGDAGVEGLARSGWARAGLALQTVSRPPGPLGADTLRTVWPANAARVLLFPALGVYDARVLKALLRSGRPAALVDSAPPPGVADRDRCSVGAGPTLCGPALVEIDTVAPSAADLRAALRDTVERGALAPLDVASLPSYLPGMRRVLRPFWMAAPGSEQERRHAEGVVVAAAQKGALDLPAYVHAPIEDVLVRLLCRTRVTPNQVSLAGNIVAWGATALFASGSLGLGVVLALVVGVLDGVDGKLARVKVETTAAGRLEHWFDTLFEVSWAVALTFFFERSGLRGDAWALLALLLSAEAVDGLAKGAVIVRCGRQIDDVAVFDRAVRLVGGRRNVYVWILAAGVLLGSAGGAFALVAWWEVVTAAVHVLRGAWLLWQPPPAAEGARRS